MIFRPPAPSRYVVPRTRPWRYAITLAIIGGASLLRLAADPLVDGQVPYVIYVAAAVVATSFGGVEAGILAALLGMPVGNYLFVSPRYTLSLGGANLAAMALPIVVSCGIVWFVGRMARAENELRTAHAQVNAVLQQLPVGVVVADTGANVLFGNSAIERILRRPFAPGTFSEFRGGSGYIPCRPDGTVLPPGDVALARALNGESVVDDEIHLLWPDGTRTLVSASATPISAEDGKIMGAVLALADVTDQRRAAETSRLQAEELRAILDTVPAVVLITHDRGGLWLDGNRLAAEVFRLPEGANFSKAVPAEQQPAFKTMSGGREIPPAELPVRAAVARTREIRDYEFDIVHPDGAVRSLFGNATPLRGPDGAVRGAVSAFVEITERKRLETDLRLRMEELSTATLAGEVGVWTWTPGTGLASVGANWRTLFGVAPDVEVTRETWVNAVHPDDRDRATSALDAALREHRPFAVDYRVVRPDGSVRWLIDRGRAAYDEGGRALLMSGISLDITERKMAEEESRRAHERYSRLFTSIREGFAHYRAVYEAGRLVDLCVLEINPAGAALSGVPAERQVGRTWREVWPGLDDRLFDHYRRAEETGTTVRFDDDNRITGRWYDVSVSPVAAGEFAVTFTDITDRKEMEESLREANRLKDEFLATLSHELRTPLNAIVGWADMLRRGSLPAEAIQRATESIYRNACVQSEMIADVLDVSRIISGKVHIETAPVDLASLLRDAMESVRTAADAKEIQLVDEIAAIPFPVSGDATRLQQVFWNLLSNAVKFSQPGGVVRVTLHMAGNQVHVTVADTGIGITPGFLPHVFERFRQRDSSSTRTQGGLGLGLAIVKHLVELHGGTVKAESPGEGRGALFTVTLPVHPIAERRQPERREMRPVRPIDLAPEDVPSLAGIRVLVLDDERDARELAASVLRLFGATVSVAASAAQALDQLALFDPHVLLVDLAMPEVDGYSFIERVRRSSGQKIKTVPAIAFTAYAREEDRRRALASGFQLHLSKPVDTHTLVRAVASLRPAA